MLQEMRIRTKLSSALGLLVGGALLVGAVGLVANERIAARAEHVSGNLLPSLHALADAEDGLTAIRFVATQAIVASLRHDDGAFDGLWTRREAARRRVEEGLKAYASLPMSGREVALWRQIEPEMALFLAASAQVFEAARARDPERAVALQREAGARFQGALVEPLERLMDLQTTLADEGRAAVAETSSASGRMIWGSLLAIALAGAAMGVLLVRSITGPIATLLAESRRLTDAVRAGALSVRADAAALSGEFRPILAGMNATMDAFARPIEVTADHVTRISRGEIPPPITDRYEGDFNAIKDALNACGEALSGLIAEMGRMSGEHERGEIDAAVDVARFKGAYRTMAEGVNAMVGAHVAAKRKAMAVFGEFGKGNFDATLEALPGKKRFINDTIDQVRRNLKDLIAELNRMSRAHDQGDIDAAIDAGRFHGDYRAMADGVNRMVDGHIAVKRKAMACVAEFGRGNFDAPLERFPGKKAFINDTVEQVRANLKALIEDADGLVQAAVAGELATRADASRHQGGFRMIVDGVNRTLDAVVAPMQESGQVLEQLAARDLRARVAGSYQGDHARMKDAVNATAVALHDALTQVAQAVDQLSSASTQIASSSQGVAAGASEQASSLEETTGSIESVTSMTRQTADSADQANHLAQAAKGAATEGAAAVEQMQGAMGKIKASAEGTSQIIRDINEIAFQTNLLALNAAVEAARAGEAGRGFAVVAEEVRSLALRAKEAATKTEELIRQSVKEAGDGEVSARHVAGKLGEIADGVSKVSAIVAEIAAAAKDQAAGIEQVTRAVGEMDKVTQQNAASAEESSSAASELSGQAEELAAMVASFQLEGQARARAVAAPGRPHALPAPAAVRPNGKRPAPRAGERPAAGEAPRARPASSGVPVAALTGPDPFPMEQASELRDF